MGLGRKIFTAGSVLTAGDVNGYLMDQCVMEFANTAARDAAIPTPGDGMVVFINNPARFTVYDGTNWLRYDLEWTSYSCSLSHTGATQPTLGVGGSCSGFYKYRGDEYTVKVELITGSSGWSPGTAGNNMLFTAPFTLETRVRSTASGQWYNASGLDALPAFLFLGGGPNFNVRYYEAGDWKTWTSSTTWGVNYQMFVEWTARNPS